MSLKITNPKIAKMDPIVWADFRGFSYLFVNPGNPLSQFNDLQAIDVDIHGVGLEFYRCLAHSLDVIGLTGSGSRFSFCPLQPQTYHVTVWDGINSANLYQLSGPAYQVYESFLAGLPFSLRGAVPSDLPAGTLKVSSDRWAVRLRFLSICNWGDTALVARLQPADSASEDILKRISQVRLELDERFQPLGKERSPFFTPHVSLGYFADKELGAKSVAELGRWSGVFESVADRQVIEFTTIGLYGFTNMARFFRNI